MLTFHPKIRKLFSIYSSDFPDFLAPFLESKALKRLAEVGQTCGIAFTKLEDYEFHLSRLDHSVGVALIIWHFTKDPKQTLAGLFHDISHTAFSHIGDYLRGDFENQNSSEIYIDKMISESPIIINELNKLGIAVEDVVDYEIYPIADNPGPQLSADRLEYNICDYICRGGNIQKAEKWYKDIVIVQNEFGQEEMTFKTQAIAKEFAQTVLETSQQVFAGYDKIGGVLLADILRKSIEKNLFNIDDLYHLGDKQALDLINNAGDKTLNNALECFYNLRYYKVRSYEPKTEEYYCDTKNKKRYINPLVISSNKTPVRLADSDENFNKQIYYFLHKPTERVSIDFSWSE